MNYYDVKLYSPEEVLCIIGGYTLANWNSITVRRSAQQFSTIHGIRGKNARVYNGDTSATIEIVVPITSEANDIFVAIHEADIQTGNGRIGLFLRDANNGLLFATGDGYIPSYPDISFAAESGTITWVINCNTSTGGMGEKRSLQSMLDGLLGTSTTTTE